jgi:thiamine biosynthesis lipoprotein
MTNRFEHPQTWRSRRFYSMGSHIMLWLDAADSHEADDAFDEAEALFAANEQAFSRFRDDSELCALNRQAGQWAEVSALLWEMVVTAVSLAEQTGGLFDPTILNALETAGYTRSFAPGMQTSSSRWLEQPAGWQTIQFDWERQAVFLPEGARLDLGGVAKGYTAQQAVELLDASGPCLVDAGGDVTAGAAPPEWPGWPVAVSTPRLGVAQPEADLFTLWLADVSLATSGVDYRRWQQDGVWQHHLIDPRNGRSAQTDALSATVLAPQAATAEAWATAIMVAGAGEGLRFLRQNGLDGLVFTQSSQVSMTAAFVNQINHSEADNDFFIT